MEKENIFLIWISGVFGAVCSRILEYIFETSPANLVQWVFHWTVFLVFTLIASIIVMYVGDFLWKLIFKK